jgi:hypothetical protein
MAADRPILPAGFSFCCFFRQRPERLGSRYGHQSRLAVRPSLRCRVAWMVAMAIPRPRPRQGDLLGAGRPGPAWRPGRHRHHALRRPAARWPRPGTALDRDAPTPPVQPGSEQQLLVDGERAGVDVAPDHVGVGRLQVDRRPRPGGPGSARGSQGHEPRWLPPSGPRAPHPSGPVRPGLGPQCVANRPGRDMGVSPRVCWPAGARLGSASDCWPRMSVGRAGSSP